MTTLVSPYLQPAENGFIHTHKNVNIRITSSTNLEPVLKAANKWIATKDMEQEYFAQLDEIWNTHEKKIVEAKTDLEIYSIIKQIPKPAIKYKDLCKNNFAHRLILALKKQNSETVEGVWYLLQDMISPNMHIVNDFGHTPWELMGAIPTAFEKVLKQQNAELLHLIPVRTWKKHPVYLDAWNKATKEMRLAFSRSFKKNHLDLLCYLTQDNPEEISELTKGNILLLEGCTPLIKNTYPLQSEYLLINLIESNLSDIIITFI
jgi:hypothetical protein